MKHRDWAAYCDICGQRMMASSATQLSTYTGHGGSIVCRHDVDAIDPGVIPFSPRVEKSIPWMRPGDTNTDNASAIVDLETMTYTYYLVSSQDNYRIMSSQDDAYITVSEPI